MNYLKVAEECGLITPQLFTGLPLVEGSIEQLEQFAERIRADEWEANESSQSIADAYNKEIEAKALEEAADKLRQLYKSDLPLQFHPCDYLCKIAAEKRK